MSSRNDYFSLNTDVGLPNFANSMGSYGNTGNWGNSGGTAPQFADATGQMSFMDELKNMNWFGSTNQNGIKQMGLADYGLGALGAGLSAFIGMKQYGLAKDQFNFQKNAWNKDFEAQKGVTNGELNARQLSRNKDGFGEDAATYMAKYGVK